MTENITVPLGSRSYSIIIGSDILKSLGSYLSDISFPKRIAVVSNTVVADIYNDVVRKTLTENG